MNILEELKRVEQKPDLKDELKAEQLPLVLWGCGQIAEDIMQYCRQYGITVDGVYVDDAYYQEGKEFAGMEVNSFSQILAKYEQFNVMIGHSNYEYGRQLDGIAQIHKVFYMFSINYAVFDKTDIRTIEENISSYEQIYELLADDLSRKNMIAFLKTRISGDAGYIIDVFEKEGTFFKNDVYQVGADEVFMDIGAFDGDTIKLFLKDSGGNYKKIYALEPDEKNYAKLLEYIQEEHLECVETTKIGAWHCKDVLRFEPEDDQISSIVLDSSSGTGVTEIQVEAIDHLFDYKEEERITLFKINYLEGVQEAFMGAKRILQKDCPKVSSTVGFQESSVYQIPLLIKEINPEYKIYLRFNRAMTSALTMYAVK